MNPLTDPLKIDALTGAFGLILPEIALLCAACLLFIAGLMTSSRFLHATIAMLALLGAAVLAFLESLAADSYRDLFGGITPTSTSPLAPFFVGSVPEFARWLTLGTGFLLVLIGYKETIASITADYLACLMVALAGTSLVARSNDLVFLYLALEMISIPTYVLLYLPVRSKAGQESAVKYFLLSVLSSAVMLFGFSYLYGITGSTNLSAIAALLTATNASAISPMAVLAMVFIIAGLGFRITAVPFHYYAPDVYQGGPNSVIAQLAVLPKIAGFFALANLLGLTQRSFGDLPFPIASQIPLMLWVLAAVTMTLGNSLALLQDNIKRMLAYSGIAHSGYLLLGLVTSTAFAVNDVPRYANGFDAILFYLVAYAFMTLGVFAILAYLNSDETTVESIDDLAGLSQTNPLTAAMLLVALLSMIGIPLTAGFSGKLALFVGLFDAPENGGMGSAYRLLTVIAAVNAAIGAVVYLRVLGAIYLRTPLRPQTSSRGLTAITAALICTTGTLLVGVYPQLIWNRAKVAIPNSPAALSSTPLR